jgi:hypothetical protein
VTEAAPGANLNSNFTADGSSTEGARWEGRFGALEVSLGLSHLSYKVTDTQTQNLTAHQRDEYEGGLGVGWRFTPFGTDDMIGLGYMLRYIGNNNQDTNGGSIPAPASPESILTVPTQLYHGPLVQARFDIPVFGPLGLDLRGGVAPYLLDAMPSSNRDLTGMLGYWAEPSLYLRFGAFQLDAGYNYTAYSASGYDYSRSGPQARVDWRF